MSAQHMSKLWFIPTFHVGDHQHRPESRGTVLVRLGIAKKGRDTIAFHRMLTEQCIDFGSCQTISSKLCLTSVRIRNTKNSKGLQNENYFHSYILTVVMITAVKVPPLQRASCVGIFSLVLQSQAQGVRVSANISSTLDIRITIWAVQ